MIIDDTFFVSDEFGSIRIEIDDSGKSIVYCDLDKHIMIYIIVKSLDTDLTLNAMCANIPVGYNMWTFDENSFIAGKLDFHPGLKIEVYDMNVNRKYTERYYHRNKRYIGVKLKSNKDSFAYHSYHTFFNDPEFLENFTIKDQDVVYDLGANIGTFSLACSNYNINKIYAFEPHTETFEYLVYNTEKYGKNVLCYKKAIGDDFKKMSFGGISTQCALGYSILPDDTLKRDEVDVINLEKFVHVNSMLLPTYLKLDIEGAEYSFFDSTSDGFFQNVHSIFFEFHKNNGYNLNKILDRLTGLGYRCVSDKNIGNPQGTVYLVR